MECRRLGRTGLRLPIIENGSRRSFDVEPAVLGDRLRRSTRPSRRVSGSALDQALETDRVDVVQVSFNPPQRSAESFVPPLAAERELGLIVDQPFGSDPLVRASPPAVELTWAAALGVRTWPQGLFRWGLSSPRVHAVIPATGRPGWMVENAAAGNPPWPGSTERVVRLAERVGAAGAAEPAA